MERQAPREEDRGEQRQGHGRPPTRHERPHRTRPHRREHADTDQTRHHHEQHRRDRRQHLGPELRGRIGVDQESLIARGIGTRPADGNGAAPHGLGGLHPDQIEHRWGHIHQLHEPGPLGRARTQQAGFNPRRAHRNCGEAPVGRVGRSPQHHHRISCEVHVGEQLAHQRVGASERVGPELAGPASRHGRPILLGPNEIGAFDEHHRLRRPCRRECVLDRVDIEMFAERHHRCPREQLGADLAAGHGARAVHHPDGSEPTRLRGAPRHVLTIGVGNHRPIPTGARQRVAERTDRRLIRRRTVRGDHPRRVEHDQTGVRQPAGPTRKDLTRGGIAELLVDPVGRSRRGHAGRVDRRSRADRFIAGAEARVVPGEIVANTRRAGRQIGDGRVLEQVVQVRKIVAAQIAPAHPWERDDEHAIDRNPCPDRSRRGGGSGRRRRHRQHQRRHRACRDRSSPHPFPLSPDAALSPRSPRMSARPRTATFCLWGWA